MDVKKLNWFYAWYFLIIHILAFYAIFYLALVKFSYLTFALTVLWFVFCGFSITGGYHRYFAHKSYECGIALKLFYLLFGAASLQNSSLNWTLDHRMHHAHTDKELDPYNITKGFWWAHMGWILHRRQSARIYTYVSDLLQDRWVVFQHKFYIPLGITFGFLLPSGIGFIWGDALGAFLAASCLRLVLQYHATFSVNSVAHTFGNQPYTSRDSSKNSFITALATIGEGNNHNFHHAFSSDYRNGVHTADFDPTKWIIWLCAKIGLARNLRKIPGEKIRQAAEKMLS